MLLLVFTVTNYSTQVVHEECQYFRSRYSHRMSMEDALPESVYNYRPQASLFKYETIQFNTVLLPEGVTQEMFLSLHGGSIRTSILKWVEA